MELMGQILIKLDTSVVVSYVNPEADKRSRNLLEESIWLFMWAELHLAFVRVCHFPDLHSVLADYFNRLGCSFGRASSLNRYIIHCRKTKVQIPSGQTLCHKKNIQRQIQICISVSKCQTFRRCFIKVQFFKQLLVICILFSEHRMIMMVIMENC